MDHKSKSEMQNYKLLDDSMRENLGDLGYGDIFFRNNSMKEIIDKLEFIKLKISALW